MKPFYMAIEEVFTIMGCGTVVTGLPVGDVELGACWMTDPLHTANRRVVITGVERIRALTSRQCHCTSCSRVGIILKAPIPEVQRGQRLFSFPTLEPT